MDGISNPYLAIAALIVAGTHGGHGAYFPIYEKRVDVEGCMLRLGNYTFDEFEEALCALEDDGFMTRMLGEEFVKQYIRIKKGELELLKSMPREARRKWIMERY